jgi:hypothetical protein
MSKPINHFIKLSFRKEQVFTNGKKKNQRDGKKNAVTRTPILSATATATSLLVFQQATEGNNETSQLQDERKGIQIVKCLKTRREEQSGGETRCIKNLRRTLNSTGF